MDILKYIVPFLGFNDNQEDCQLIGTAFIVRPDFLITAGHNIKESINVFKYYAILFENNIVVLKEPKYIEFDYKLIVSGVCNDLAIFKLEFEVENAFKLICEELKVGDKYEIIGYCEASINNIYKRSHEFISVENPVCSFRNFPNARGAANLSQYLNCICFNEKVKKGYSGCPVFKENSVVGMIIYGSEEENLINVRLLKFGVTALKSEYILENINE